MAQKCYNYIICLKFYAARGFNMQQTNSFKGIVMLLLCSFIWGTAFVAQSVGADLLGPFSFNGIRSFLGAFFLFRRIFSCSLHCRNRQAFRQTAFLLGN